MQNSRLFESNVDKRWLDVAHRWSSHAEHAQVVPVREEETVQLGRGVADWRALWACGLDAALTHMGCQTSHCTNIVLNSDWVAVVVPTSILDSVRVNGWQADLSGFFFSATSDGYCATGGGRTGFALGLRRSRLAAACCALSGIDRDDLKMQDLEVPLGCNGTASLHALLWAAISDSLKRPISEGRHALSDFWEDEIFSRFAQILSPLLCSREPPQLSRLNPLRVVRAAETACADLAYPPTMSELCAAAGVGERWLRKCFWEIRGASPAQFLLMRRLSAAHQRLLESPAEKRSVKEVALSLGFMESGRFAAYYRDVFHELPHETLDKSRQPQ
jgi:AraC-like DNA-binding protein